jgi:hypothetical protein
LGRGIAPAQWTTETNQIGFRNDGKNQMNSTQPDLINANDIDVASNLSKIKPIRPNSGTILRNKNATNGVNGTMLINDEQNSKGSQSFLMTNKYNSNEFVESEINKVKID